ncbi:thiamine pyrophosphate-binding protein [Cupriavidus basilensis]
MSAVAPTRSESTTAEDTLKQKTRDAGVISGGHLVARALKNEGVDTIFTLCGGHIIDIYDGCVDEGIRIIDVRHEQVAAHAADGYARRTGKLGCVVTTAGPGCTNAVTGVATAFRSESLDHPHRRAGCPVPAQDGFAAGPAARRHDVAHHQVRGHHPQHRARGGHDLDGGARVLQWRARPVVPGNPARCARPRSRCGARGDSAPRPLSCFH